MASRIRILAFMANSRYKGAALHLADTSLLPNYSSSLSGASVVSISSEDVSGASKIDLWTQRTQDLDPNEHLMLTSFRELLVAVVSREIVNDRTIGSLSCLLYARLPMRKYMLQAGSEMV